MISFASLTPYWLIHLPLQLDCLVSLSLHFF